MASKTDYKETNPPSGFNWLAALAIFLLPLFITALSGTDASRWIMNLMYVFFLGCIVLAIVLAIKRELPRWSFSYLGLVLTIFVFYSLLWVLWGLIFYTPWMIVFGPMDTWSLPVRILYQGLMVVFMCFLVLALTLVMIKLFQHLFTTIWQFVRGEWIHLSYLVYGGLVFYIWLIFDEYLHENSWLFAAFTSLAIGGWLYLRARRPIGRFTALVGGTTAAMWIVAIGKWNLVPIQNWPVDLQAERLFEFLRTISSWIVTIAALSAPALLYLLPPFLSSNADETITSA
jgi:hypothetical protein